MSLTSKDYRSYWDRPCGVCNNRVTAGRLLTKLDDIVFCETHYSDVMTLMRAGTLLPKVKVPS